MKMDLNRGWIRGLKDDKHSSYIPENSLKKIVDLESQYQPKLYMLHFINDGEIKLDCCSALREAQRILKLEQL